MNPLSIIVPTLNEAHGITAALAALTPFRMRGAEIIVADGGSEDRTPELARPFADHVIDATRGRGAQMNDGASIARGYIFLFLHADTRLPPDADTQILYGRGRDSSVWGRFDVDIEGHHRLLPMVAALMNWRSRASGIATGDQAMFVTREAFFRVGGFPEIPLMEDVEMSRRLKRVSAPLCLQARVRTSGRRWEQHGVMRTIWLMWRLRLAYYLGTDPAELARRYGYRPHEGEA